MSGRPRTYKQLASERAAHASLRPEQRARLAREAERLDMSKAALVRLGLDLLFAAIDAGQVPRVAEAAFRSYRRSTVGGRGHAGS